MTLQTPATATVRLIARMLSIVLFIFWGAFFVEHLTWFGFTLKHIPPLTVWLLSALHLGLLLSYLISLKWEQTGSILMIVSAVFFFSSTAGYNAIPFITVSVLPALLYGYCHIREKRVAGVK